MAGWVLATRRAVAVRAEYLLCQRRNLYLLYVGLIAQCFSLNPCLLCFAVEAIGMPENKYLTRSDISLFSYNKLALDRESEHVEEVHSFCPVQSLPLASQAIAMVAMGTSHAAAIMS